MIFPVPISFGTLTMPATITRKSKKPDVFDEVIAKRTAKSSHGPLPAALTGITTPAGIAANDPDAGERWQETHNAGVAVFDTDELMRHPDNREPTEQDIIAKMLQFQKEGQLEPVVLWPPPKDWPHRQGEKLVIISGETRWHAAKRLGWTLQGRIAVGLTPAQALEHLAAYNGERRDLDPMQKARLINRLCQPVAEGGAGLTRQAAGERVGLESGAAASNLVRLLELPKKWQDRVASGELAWSWAREMIPYIGIEPVMAAAEKDWKERDKERASWDSNLFDSRAALVEGLEDTTTQETYDVDAKHFIGNKSKVLKISPEDLERLQIVAVDLPGTNKKLRLATNSKLFEELLESERQKGKKTAAAKAGDDNKPEPVKLNPAQIREKQLARGNQLRELIANWRQRLLRIAILELLDADKDDGVRLVLAYAARPTHHSRPTFAKLLEKASNLPGRNAHWNCVADDDATLFICQDMAKQLLADEPANWREPTLPFELVECYAAALKVDVAAVWQRAQETVSGTQRLAGEDLLEDFFLLHRTDELRDLAKELGKHVPETANRGAMVKLLLAVPRGSNQRLPLPKSIKPLAGVKPAKGKKGAK